MIKFEVRRRAFCASLLAGMACICLGIVTLFIAAVSAQHASAQAAAPTTPPAAQTAAPAATPASPTDIVGTWQGTLKFAANGDHPAMDLRLVFKISRTDAGALKAVWYSIDQGGQPAPIATVNFQDGVLKFTITVVPRSYEGKMSGDGKSIAGTWMEGTSPMPLPLERANPDTAWAIPEPPKMMDAKAKPEFEVATIKPSDPSQPGWGIRVDRSGMFTTRNTTLSDLIKFAYSVHPKQIIGAPSWIDSNKFDLSAKPDTPGIPSVDQMRAMLQKLLADRFSLSFHTEKRELSAYAITVANGGNKLTKEENAPVPVPGFGGMPQRGFNVRNATIAEFAAVMQAQFMDQPVVDQSGLGDTRYSFMLKWTPDPSQSAGYGAGPAQPNPQPQSPDADAPPDLFAAMQQQLGLQMKMTKTSVDMMVIDHVEQPSAN